MCDVGTAPERASSVPTANVTQPDDHAEYRHDLIAGQPNGNPLVQRESSGGG